MDAYFSLFYLLVEEGRLDEASGVYRQIQVRAPDQAVLPERYQIQAILGQSSVGIAYRVWDTESQQLVTVTILRRTLAAHKEILEQFGQQMGQLSSERISHLLGLDRYRGRAYLVTDYVEGQTLRSRLSAGPRMSLQEAYQIFDQVAEALADGHRQGVAHLSLQPENIILGPPARYSSTPTPRSSTNWRARLAPRAAELNTTPRNSAPVPGDAASDIYALGTILYEMLTGRHPGVGTFQTTSEIRPEADEAVDVLIARARAIDPTKRYRSVDEMRQETQRLWGRSRAGRPDHYLRQGLVLTSELYSRLVSWPGILALIALLLLYIGVFEA